MALPPVPENLENVVVIREYLDKLRIAIEEGGAEIDPVFLAQKGQANGVPVLDSLTLIPTSELGTGVADSTKVLKGDRTWGTATAGSGDIKSDGSVPFAANESMGGFKLTSVGTPTVGTDAANKNYVDNNEKYAATFIVDPVVGAGTHTTIEAAVAAAPAAGADIYVKGGTFAPVGTITLPLAKPINIRGGGIGVTKITIPTGVPLFTVAGGSSAEYSFSGFEAIGDFTAQALISTASAVDFYFDNIEVADCRRIVQTTSTPTVTFTNCSFDMPGGVFSFWFGTSGGQLVWNYVTASHGNGSATAVTGSPEWIVTTGYIGGPSYSVYALGHVLWHGLRLDLSDVTIAGFNSKIDACEFSNVGITVNADSFACDQSSFSGGDSGSTFQLKLSGDQNAVTGCLFQGGSARGIDILSTSVDNSITGCWFFAYVLEGIRTASSNLVASGNIGLEVTETGAANNNLYTGNAGFTATITGVASQIGADGSVFIAENKDSVTIKKGQPVSNHSSGTGVIRAIGTGLAGEVVGLANEDIGVGEKKQILVDGRMYLASWVDATGAASLTAEATYFLDIVAAKITTTAPSTIGQIVQMVGKTASPNVLVVKISDSILL